MLMRTLAATMLLCVATIHAVTAQDWDWDRGRGRRHRDGVQIRVARDYHLPANQIATWPVVVIGGSATIDGRLEDDLVVIGGPVRIGPAAEIRGDVVSIGGGVDVADSAQVSGEVHDVGVLWPDIQFAFREWVWGLDRGWWAAFGLATLVFRFAAMMIFACLFALIAPGWIRRIADRASDAPLASGFVGLGAEILVVPFFVIATVALFVTIVGIPLLVLMPFAVLAFLITWLAGFTAVAALLGGRLRTRTNLATDSAVIDVAWGVMVLFLVTFVGHILAFGPWVLQPASTALGLAGFVIEYLAWTIGLGAALLAPLRPRWTVVPPPVPSEASARA